MALTSPRTYQSLLRPLVGILGYRLGPESCPHFIGKYTCLLDESLSFSFQTGHGEERRMVAMADVCFENFLAK